MSSQVPPVCWLQAAARMAASAAAAMAQEAAELSAGSSGAAPDQASKTAKQEEQSGKAKKARQRQRQRKQVPHLSIVCCSCSAPLSAALMPMTSKDRTSLTVMIAVPQLQVA